VLCRRSFQLIYIDPPVQHRPFAGAPHSQHGLRSRRLTHRLSGAPLHHTRLLTESSYRDSFEDYLAFLQPRLLHARRLLTREGSLYFHINYRESHYRRLLLDEIFGRDCFLTAATC
jgi:site-specific DNA-methyltransferase (adenine-specific)